jgi:hypothetical protein
MYDVGRGGGKILDASARRGSFHNVPYCLRCEPVASKLAHAAHTTENDAGADSSGDRPCVKGPLNPRRDWDGADMLSLANQICDDPMFFPDLEILHPEADQLSAP